MFIIDHGHLPRVRVRADTLLPVYSLSYFTTPAGPCQLFSFPGSKPGFSFFTGRHNPQQKTIPLLRQRPGMRVDLVPVGIHDIAFLIHIAAGDRVAVGIHYLSVHHMRIIAKRS